MEIRELHKIEYTAMTELTLRVFMQYEAPDYSQQGVDTFQKLMCNPGYMDEIRAYGAFDGDKLVGVLATRNNGCHITLFFVDGEHHRLGIGKSLFFLACADCNADKITVNSSPYAVEVYRRLGFRATSDEEVSDGIRFTHMECVLRNPECICKRKKCERHSNCALCHEHHKNKKKPVFCERTE